MIKLFYESSDSAFFLKFLNFLWLYHRHKPNVIAIILMTLLSNRHLSFLYTFEQSWAKFQFSIWAERRWFVMCWSNYWVCRAHIIFLMYLLCGLAPSSQTVGFLLILPGWQSGPGKWCEHSSNGFEKHKNLTNSDITMLSTKIAVLNNRITAYSHVRFQRAILH